MLRLAKAVAKIGADAFGHYFSDDGWAMASHVALSILMAIFPFLIFATALASFVGAKAFADTAVHLVFDTWPQQIAGPIAGEVRRVLTEQHGGILTVSVAVAAYFASNGIEALRVSLNRAYRIPESRSFVICRLQSLAFVLLATMGMTAISFLLVLAPLAIRIGIEWFPQLSHFSGTIGFWRYLIASVVLALSLIIVHLFLPARRHNVRQVLPGIAMTLVAWFAAAGLFARYLERFANYVSTYAGLASIVIAIVFLYIIAAIFIMGAEVNAALMRYRAGKAVAG
jgi:membrane protein